MNNIKFKQQRESKQMNSVKSNAYNKCYKCSKCKKDVSGYGEAYEYRGALSCEDCFEDVIDMRDFQRREIISEESVKTDKFNGLDLGYSAIGKANREILKGSIEVASKESVRLKEYEGRLTPEGK